MDSITKLIDSGNDCISVYAFSMGSHVRWRIGPLNVDRSERVDNGFNSRGLASSLIAPEILVIREK